MLLLKIIMLIISTLQLILKINLVCVIYAYIIASTNKITTNNLNFKKMKLINENLDLQNFDAWSGAKDTKETILKHNKERDFEYLIEELYPDGITETQLNDILWFDSEWIFESIGIDEEEESEEEE